MHQDMISLNLEKTGSKSFEVCLSPKSVGLYLAPTSEVLQSIQSHQNKGNVREHGYFIYSFSSLVDVLADNSLSALTDSLLM